MTDDDDDSDWFAEAEEQAARADLVASIFAMVAKTIREQFGLTIDEADELIRDDRREAERLI
jgi:hypothetical protein